MSLQNPVGARVVRWLERRSDQLSFLKFKKKQMLFLVGIGLVLFA